MLKYDISNERVVEVICYYYYFYFDISSNYDNTLYRSESQKLIGVENNKITTNLNIQFCKNY